jgi:hypothetical protein
MRTTDTQEATDPIARLEADVLRFTPSRGWQIVVVTFPATPDSDVVIPHSLTVDTPEAVNYQVLQTNVPQAIYHAPTSTWTHSEIRLRSTTGNGQAVVLLTTSKVTNPKLGLFDTANNTLWKMGGITFTTDTMTMTDGTIRFVNGFTSYTMTSSSTAFSISGSRIVIPATSGSVTMTLGSATVGGNGSRFAGSSTMTGVFQNIGAGSLAMGVVSATLTADQNDYAPTGIATCGMLLLSPSGASRVISGISSDLTYSGWAKTGRHLTVVNNAAALDLTLSHLGAGSSAGNRFNLPHGQNLVLGPGEGATFIYNGTNWSLANKNAAYTGVGLKFPSTQVPSSDANTLDDYEEGTFTPGVLFGGSATGLTYNSQTGRYIKIGSLVVCWIRLDIDQKGSSTGTATLTGLPFTVLNENTQLGGGVATRFAAMSGLTGFPGIRLNANATTGTFITGGATGSADLTDANFNNSASMYLTVSYNASA